MLFYRLTAYLTTLQSSMHSFELNIPALENIQAEKEEAEFLTRKNYLAPSVGSNNFDVNIELENVGFSYSGRELLFQAVSLTVPFGSMIAFIGPTGGGKTTLVDIMTGLIKPTTGKVKFLSSSDNDFESEPASTLIAYVGQDSFMFSGTIRENLLFGIARDLSEKEIFVALENAQIVDLVQSLEHGLDAKIGFGGIGLSGGERQRLSIARALLRNPKILVLDEATSALDGYTEKKIKELIMKLRKSMTIITIAHRYATLEGADAVYFVGRNVVRLLGAWQEVSSSNHQLINDAFTEGSLAMNSSGGVTD